jgi:hypothetical protein
MSLKSVIATSVITGVVAVFTGMLLFWWQAERPDLTYNSIRSIPFDNASNKLFIQQIEIQNSGNKSVDDVVLLIEFSDEVIEKSRISIDKTISHKIDSNEKSIQLKIDSLNPGEIANLSVLYQSANSMSAGAKISLRGRGIVGKPIGSKSVDTKNSIYIGLVAAYAGLMSIPLSTKRGRDRVKMIINNLILRKPFDSEQKNNLASIISMYGYPEKAREYLNSGSERKYWVEADLLAAEALLGNEKLKEDTIQILLAISKISMIAETSKCIIHYNIARIYRSLNNNDKVKENIKLAKALNESEVKQRLQLDPMLIGHGEI